MQKTSPALFSPIRRNAVEARALAISDQDSDFLFKEASEIISERLDATNRDFPVAVDVFSLFDTMLEKLKNSDKTKDVQAIRNVLPKNVFPKEDNELDKFIVSQPEEIPLKPKSVNLITSIFGLHRSNDLPGTLLQIRNALIEDGLFLAAIPGDRTLMELRDCLLEAESNINGNATLRIDPFGEVRQLGGLLQRAGFTLPVVDTEVLTVRYSTFQKLVSDLRGMGANSCLRGNRQFGPRNLFEKTEEIYHKRYSDSDGKIRATFEIVFLSGWAPHASQQKPLKPGSAKNKLSDFLEKK